MRSAALTMLDDPDNTTLVSTMISLGVTPSEATGAASEPERSLPGFSGPASGSSGGRGWRSGRRDGNGAKRRDRSPASFVKQASFMCSA
jgi:hypothetical protein